MTVSTFPHASILGYPRIGRDRELKRAVEAYWAGKIGADDLEKECRALRLDAYARLVELGLGRDDSSIPDTFSYYDQVLDVTSLVGAIPERFAGRSGIDLYFALARGDSSVAPLEMTKWFDTNYHYLVPELSPSTPISFADSSVITRFKEAQQAGFRVRPVLVGPLTWLALSKPAEDAPHGWSPLELLDAVVGVYEAVLGELAKAGASWVQLEEPALISDNLNISRDVLLTKASEVYSRLSSLVPGSQRPALLVSTPFGDGRAALARLAKAGVEAVHLDLVRGSLPQVDECKAVDLGSVTLVAGIVEGRNVWAADLEAARKKIETLRALGEVAVSTSTSLQHVPYDVDREKWEDSSLDSALHSWLAFADQKVVEVVTLARGISQGWDSISAQLASSREVVESRASFAGVKRDEVRARTSALTPEDRSRAPHEERDKAQTKRLALPLLPTTTIGSFPQTSDIRKVRAAHARGTISREEYTARIREEIASVISVQEELGLDVLVHGEPERNDMVQYFAELLDGCAVTSHGWVQSYGSRCTRPSILWGDVSRSVPLTIPWTTYAQSLTDKPVKGMLTGPVTIIAWSFVRNDIPLSEVADQIALALRDEVADLEEAGIAIIQVDEPALRELLPLEKARQAEYLRWSVGAFRAATSGVRPDTQIHTHLCYSEFGQVIEAIAHLDADVTSIEAARSRMEVLPELASSGFAAGVGPGVWDIHSPRVPSAEELVDLVSLACRTVAANKLWVNPDCGLKTRAYPETLASLANLVAAAKQVRSSLEI